MRTRKELPLDLFPQLEEMTDWQQCVFEAIKEIQGNWAPYKWGGGSGCTKSRKFRRHVVMRAARPPTSYCCGAQFEAFLLAWRNWIGYSYQTPDDITLPQMKKLYAYSFLFSGLPNAEKGLAAPEALPSIISWQPWLAEEEGVSVEQVEPLQARFGDFCQIQNGPGLSSGHSVIVLGQGEWKKKNVLHVWSSNLNYDQEWPYSKGQEDGHGVDYYYMDRRIRQKDGSLWTRKFHIVRFAD